MNKKKILVINGHPDDKSFNYSLSKAYIKGAEKTATEIKKINIGELNFNPNLQYGYRERTNLEPDLLDAQDKLKWADHLVWIYPVWWGSFPAIMKGFLDRVLLPGFAFNKRTDSLWWEGCFKGKTARIICTLDQPHWYYKIVYRSPSTFAMKKCTLNYIGIKNVKTTTIGPIRRSTVEFRQKWIRKIEKLGERNR